MSHRPPLSLSLNSIVSFLFHGAEGHCQWCTHATLSGTSADPAGSFTGVRALPPKHLSSCVDEPTWWDMEVRHATNDSTNDQRNPPSTGGRTQSSSCRNAGKSMYAFNATSIWKRLRGDVRFSTTLVTFKTASVPYVIGHRLCLLNSLPNTWNSSKCHVWQWIRTIDLQLTIISSAYTLFSLSFFLPSSLPCPWDEFPFGFYEAKQSKKKKEKWWEPKVREWEWVEWV